MDAFIIYKAVVEELLNLNYLILKEMADVRNHNTRALPFGAFRTKIFLHFNISIKNQPSQGLGKGFSMNTIKKGKNLGVSEDEREKERVNIHDMEVEGNLEIPLQIEGIYVDPSTQKGEQDVEHDAKIENKEEDIHEGVREGVHVEDNHGEYPSQGEPPA
ncbi:hypothetical protein Acr_12g0001560 [Actinidia rufa]|uniref:Uncharacterized protein n=1 Tax=Actinidia rufa TaxID=165716 RepID=A0A7J0FG25_9ERIC|nr:hypothetical protein Acr_12g0001560 [Actinidia rufa]